MLWPIAYLFMCSVTQAQGSSASGVADPAALGKDTTSTTKDTILIDEVQVNTGYQRIPKERATGSFVQIDSTLYHRSVSTDIISRLKSVVPSLLFDERGGGDPLLSIRGRSTIYANAAPLIVVDNFPYEGDLRSINPNDVASVSILRDAAAASIWGVRAGNGVIVITTKQGRLNQPLRINLNSNVTIGTKPDLWYEPRISPSDMVDVEQFLYEQGYFTAQLGNTRTYPAISPAVEILASEVWSESEKQQQLNQLRQQDIRDDIVRYFYQPEVKQQYALNLSGGGQHHGFYLAGGFDKVQDSRVGNGFNRVNISTQTHFSPITNLKITAGLFYAQDQRQRNNVYRDVLSAPPYARLIGEDGMALPLAKDYRLSFAQEAAERGLLDWTFVPLDELQLTDNTVSATNIRANTSITYTLPFGISADIRYQYEQQGSEGRDLSTEETYYVRDLVNMYSSVGASGVNRNVPLGAYLYLTNSSLQVHNGRAQLNYDHHWASHDIHLLGGFEARQVSSNGYNRNYYGYDIHTGVGSVVNADSLYARYPSGTRTRLLSYNSTSSTVDRYRSWYFNGAYTFRSRYTVSASGRIDQSNIFGVNTNQRSVPLWSAGIKWNAAKEAFVQTAAWIDQLDLRLSYGLNGNLDQSLTAYTTARYGIYNNLQYAQLLNPPNPKLRWERTAVFNAGLDFGLFHGRLSGQLDYYRRKGTDLVGDGPLDPTSGFSEYRGNLANMVGHGADIALNSVNIDGSRLRWATDLIISYSVDKVTKYFDDSSPLSAYFNEALLDGIIPPHEGQPLSGVYSYRWAGLDPATGSPRGFLDGAPSSNFAAISNATAFDSLVYHGRALPPLFGSLRNTVTIGAFEVSANITYKLGHYFRRTSIEYDRLYRGTGGHSDFAQRWQQPGDESQTQVPAMPYPSSTAYDNFYANSEVLVARADHIRLQDVRVSYTLPAALASRLTLKNCQLYAYLNNVGVLWRANNHDIDPDYSMKRRVINGGAMVLPAPFTCALGLNLTL